MMRLESVSIRGLGPFKDFSVDLGDYGDSKLIAVTGGNGAGKSTLLELALPGALYRSTPTRGSLTALATSRNAILEARVVNGQAWTLRHVIDGVSGKSEAVALDGEGHPAFDSSKVRDFDAWATKHLPSPEVLFSCMFSPQGAAGFLGAKPAERKTVLLRILGVERLESLAERARQNAKGQRAKLEVLVARITDERARGGEVVNLGAAKDAAIVSDQALAEARGKLEKAEKLRQEYELALQASERQREKRRALEGSIEKTKAALADLDQRIHNNRALLEDAANIREKSAELESLRQQLSDLKAEWQRKWGEVSTLRASIGGLESQLATARHRLAAANNRLAAAGDIRKAAAELPSLSAGMASKAATLAEARQALEEVQGRRIAGSDERIRGLRGGLERIVAEPDNSETTAHETLDTDSAAVALAAELPAEVAAARAALASAEDAHMEAQRAHDTAKATAAKLDTIDQAEAEAKAAEAEIAKLGGTVSEKKATLQGLDAEMVTGGEALGALEAHIATLEPVAKKLPPLQNAETRLSELEPQTETARSDLASLEAELEGTPGVDPPRYLVDVDAVRQSVDGAERAARSAHEELARLQQRHEAATASAERVAELEQERGAVETELADWNRVGEDLGKNGLQALEIDAAGPELTELCNDLLHTCHGPRFTVRVDTQRLAADGKRMLEGCDVVVVDSEKGREAPGETFSGGERVIISEALSLALSMLACRRAGLEGVTLVRDESGAALDPTNARAWVAMLRRAVDIVGADRALFVSHSDEVIDMADARIDVGTP